MVPQQSQDGNAAATTQSELDAKDENDLMPSDYQDSMTVFGSQQVKETSNTPYTDATQVCHNFLLFSRKISIFHSIC